MTPLIHLHKEQLSKPQLFSVQHTFLLLLVSISNQPTNLNEHFAGDALAPALVFVISLKPGGRVWEEDGGRVFSASSHCCMGNSAIEAYPPSICNWGGGEEGDELCFSGGGELPSFR